MKKLFLIFLLLLSVMLVSCSTGGTGTGTGGNEGGENGGNEGGENGGNQDVVELKETTVYLVGDSTVCSFSDSYYYPRYGYGTQLGNYLNDKVTINNLALSGRSSKSFLSEANYQTLISSIKAGDYLIIGFGHNDEKSDDGLRFTDASKPTTDSTSFKFSLYENYIKVAIEKGATPILCTPIVRANNKNDYSGAHAHKTENGDYAQAIVELGSEKGVTVINLTEITKEKYLAVGYEEAIYYHAITTGKYDADGATVVPDTSSVDTTHLNIYGAKYVAYKLAESLKNSNCLLGKYVLDGIKEPTKETLVSLEGYIVPSYAAPVLENYVAPEHFTTISDGWYGTGFGDCGGTPTSSSNGFLATEYTEGVFTVGQYKEGSNKGKFASGGDGFCYVFKQVEASKNFKITVEAKIIKGPGVNQAGFGLMLRDDIYINQNISKTVVASNFVAAGFLGESSGMGVLFSRENTTLKKGLEKISEYYQVDDTATLTIERVGQSVTTTVVYKGVTYTHIYYDFDLFAVDQNYMYIGMFANRGTVVEFTNVNFEITGESQGA